MYRFRGMQRRWLFGFTFPGTMKSYPLWLDIRLRNEFDICIHQQPCSDCRRIFTASQHVMLRESKWLHEKYDDIKLLNGEHELHSIMKPTDLNKEMLSKAAVLVSEMLNLPVSEPAIILQLRSLPDKVVRSQYRWDPQQKFMQKEF